MSQLGVARGSMRMNPLVKRFFFLSAALMISGFVVAIAVVVAQGPPNLATSSIFVMLIGFTLLPTGGTVEWFLPEGKQRGYGRRRSLVASTVLAVALAYWAYAILNSLVSTADAFPLIWIGVILTSLGWLMYLWVDVTRRNKELR